MNLITGLAVFFVIWWMVLFAVLPFRVRSQEEAGDVNPGTVASAPDNPHIGFKFLVTTLISVLIFLCVYATIEYQLIDFDAIPFLPDFKAYGTSGK